MKSPFYDPATGQFRCKKKGLSPALAAEMYALYQSGASLAAVDRKYERARHSAHDIFVRRGWALRPMTARRPEYDPVTGKIKPYTPATQAQIDAAIRTLTRVRVPDALRVEWRHRPMAWRRKLIRRIRKHLYGPSGWAAHMRPRTPFSPNVTPFEYGDPAAHALLARINRGRTSQTKLAQIKPSCQGVIWGGGLWIWTAHVGAGYSIGYLSSGKWMTGGNKASGKRLLHHVIWEHANRSQIPAQHLVTFKDGNRNNLDPRNLALLSMADNARRNAWHKPGRLPAARVQRIAATIAEKRAATRAAQSRAGVAALLGEKQDAACGLLAALNRRNEP